jgi:histidine phosphotransferase ChpT
MSNLNVADLVASRICHDLINPVGAIANGVELMEMTGTTSEELDLISEGIHHTSARVRYFRIAFGQADARQQIGPSEVRAIFDERRSDRISLLWNVQSSRPRQEIKAVFLAIMCLETALPRGGDIKVSFERGWSIVASADVVDAKPDLWEALADMAVPTGIAPQTVSFALLPDILRGLKFEPVVEISNTRLAVHFD